MTYNKKTEAPHTVQEPVAEYGIKKVEKSGIPLDANGVPVGIPWEVIRERMYDNLSKHYGVDLRTLE